MFPFIQQNVAIDSSTVPDAIAELALGKPIVVVGGEAKEKLGTIVFAAEFATSEVVAFTVRHSSGILCVAMTPADCDRLDLPPMWLNRDPQQVPFTVSVDSANVESTGISADDRSYTIRTLASARTNSDDFTRPGHVFPLRAAAGGCLERAGHTEAAFDFARLAGLRPTAVVAAIVNDDGTIAAEHELMRFAARHSLAIITISDLISYRLANETHVHRTSAPSVALPREQFRTMGYRSDISAHQIVALVRGDIDGLKPPVVRVLLECVHGQLFGTSVCSCDEQLATHLTEIGRADSGILICVSQPALRPGLLDRLSGIDDDRPLALESGCATDRFINSLISQVLRDLGVDTEWARQIVSKMSIRTTPGTRGEALDGAA